MSDGEAAGAVQAAFAATLVDEWARAGVGHAVVSPGSRSAPLALALAAEPRLRLHVHLDERSAGFMALGIGKATGVPAVVLTTSGTAAVELHPAVVEAAQSRVPLLACTANRPAELHGIGAPQTVDQTHLFGRAVRWFCQPGVATATTATTWRSLAARTVAEAMGSPPGPVHLDLAFCDPLVARPGALPPGRAGGGGWHQLPRWSSSPEPAELAEVEAVVDGQTGVIVAGAGSGAPGAVHALAAVLGWPVLADPPSGCRDPAPATVAAFDAVLRHPRFADEHRPAVVLRLGEPPASKVLAEWLARSGARQVVIERHGTWLDPARTAAMVVAGDPSAWCAALAGRAGPGEAGVGWAASWAAAEAVAQEAIEVVVARRGGLTEPGVARTTAAALPAGTTLVVASSMPVRDLEWYAAPRHGLRVLANRGANGIDGMVSTTAGVALASGGPTALLVGDLAFLHDANGLLGLAERAVDLTIVVVDNAGGGIFSFLPAAELLAPERFELLFGTPQRADLAALAAAHGVAASAVRDLAELGAALEEPQPAGGTRALIATTDRHENVAVHDEVHAEVATALDRQR
ncbi:MAG: 2-succinyl-5-enolpyruvyl-6-hydroxy-3-cyclohexene-1-carboxylic-acid synthase [Acidimicrobiales bacterium]